MKISQREARRMKKRLVELEQMEDRRRQSWRSDYPGGVNLVNIVAQSDVHAMIRTARKLGHAVVVTHNGTSELQFYALPLVRS